VERCSSSGGRWSFLGGFDGTPKQDSSGDPYCRGRAVSESEDPPGDFDFADQSEPNANGQGCDQRPPPADNQPDDEAADKESDNNDPRMMPHAASASEKAPPSLEDQGVAPGVFEATGDVAWGEQCGHTAPRLRFAKPSY
jgi:hypothetical protein